METITISGLDKHVGQSLLDRASRGGCSVESLIREILAKEFAMPPTCSPGRGSFARYCGVWARQEFQEFSAATAEFSRVDPRDWA